MNDFLKQFGGLIGAGVAAAACAGKVAVIAALSAVGLGAFLEHAYLYPVFVGFVALSLWMLFRSAEAHGSLAPFWLSLTGGVLGAIGLWLSVTGTVVFPGSWYLFVAAVLFLGGTFWDFANGRQAPVCAQAEIAETPAVPLGRRAVNGAALSIAAATAFYGMYKSVETFAPKAEAGEIPCWGINACKGQTACSTAFNGCPGRNDCRGRGFLHVSAKECAAHDGVPLEGSEADPKKKG